MIRSLKFKLLVTQILLFAFIYFFLPENHFSGINKIEDILKDKLLKQKIEQNIEQFSNTSNTNGTNGTTVKEKVDEIEKDVDKIIEHEKTKHQSFLDKFFVRLYFSCTTCASLGYGDVTPKSKVSRSLSMIQMTTTFFIYFM